MARFLINCEHIGPKAFPKIRESCKGKGIRITKAVMDELFLGQAWITVSCEDKRGANKVRDFIWNEINHGAYCNIERLPDRKKKDASRQAQASA